MYKLFFLTLFFINLNGFEGFENYDRTLYFLATNNATAEMFARKISSAIYQIKTSRYDTETQNFLTKKLICATISNKNLHHGCINTFSAIYILAECNLKKFHGIETTEYSDNIENFKSKYERDLQLNIKIDCTPPQLIPINTYPEAIKVLESGSLFPLGFAHLIAFLETEVLSLPNANITEKNILLRKIIANAIRNPNVHQYNINHLIDIFKTASNINGKSNLLQNVQTNSQTYYYWINKAIKVISDEEDKYQQALKLFN
jgi:hypothetical protein